MSDDELEHLVSMANDIARNVAFYDDPDLRLADHLRRFWAPALRRRIMDHEASGGGGLSPAARRGVRRLHD